MKQSNEEATAMTGGVKRLTLILGAAVLGAAIVVGSIAPESSAAPRQKTGFIITTALEGGQTYLAGTWKARGALTGSGGRAIDDSRGLQLFPPGDPYGSTWMLIELTDDTFEIVQATGVYAHLQGATGTYTSHWVLRYNDMYGWSSMKGGHKLTGTIPQ